MRLSGAAIALLVPMLGVAVVNLLFAPRLRRATRPLGPPVRVSLLVPARDEEDNLRENLPSWLASDYSELEIVVLDDASSDGTSDIVRSFIDPVNSGLFVERDGSADTSPPSDDIGKAVAAPGGVQESARPAVRLTLLRGKPLPVGWLGKPWACRQLAAAATGEILIFCDADVSLAPEAVSATVATMGTMRADVLTAFPRQRLQGPIITAVVPLIANLTIGALLPLPLVPRRWPRAAAVGNGQYLTFTRDAYSRCGGHDAVRAQIVEDVELARHAKRESLRVVATLAPDLLAVRMYATNRSLIEGFTKNAFHLAGGTAARAAAIGSVFALVGVYPLVGLALGVRGSKIATLLLTAVRVCVAIAFRHPASTVLLHPVGAVVTLWILARSTLAARRGTLTWKGRLLTTNVDG